MGSLIHQFWTITEAHAAHLGVVVAVRDGGRELDLAVARRWPAEPEPDLWQRLRAALRPPEPRGPATFRLTPPVEWTDPHVSPVQFGLAGGRRAVELGAAVFVVEGPTTEALEVNERTLDSIALAFEPEVRAAYPDRPDEALVADLANPSRKEMAAAALLARGPLPAAVLFGIHEASHLRGFLGELLDRLDPAALARFAADYARAAAGTEPGQRRDRLAHVTEELLRRLPGDGALRAATAELAAALDPEHKPEAQALYSVHSRLRTLLDDEIAPGPGWGEGVLRSLRAVGSSSGVDEGFRRIVAALEPGDRRRVQEGLAELLHGPRRKGLGKDRTALWTELSGQQAD